MVCKGITGGSSIIQHAKDYLGFVAKTNGETIKKGVKFVAKAAIATPFLGVGGQASATAGMTTAEAIKYLNEQNKEAAKPLQQANAKSKGAKTAQETGNTLPEVEVKGSKSYSEIGWTSTAGLLEE